MKLHSAIVLVATVAAVCATDTRAAIITSPLISIDRPGWASTSLSDVNSAGKIAGMSSDSSGTASEGFVLSGGVFTPITVGAGFSTATMGISDDGTVVGYYWNSTISSNQYGFIADGANISTYNVPGSSQTSIRGISPNGRYLSGHYSVVPNSDTTGFVYDRLTASLFTLPPGEPSVLRGVNSFGIAAGNTFFPRIGLIVDSTSGRIDEYSSVLGRDPSFRDITDSGFLVGFTSSSILMGRPGDWTLIGREAGMTSFLAQGVNESLTIVGSWTDTSGISHGFITSVVPEPPIYILAIAGLIMLTSKRRENH